MTNNHSYINAPTETVMTSAGNTVAYRQIGNPEGTPLIGLIHLSGNLDNWDPTVLDKLASQHWVITFDYQGVGASSGSVAETIQGMAADSLAFIHAMGFKQVDLFGFSMGGMVAQEMILKEPALVRRAILTGTGPRGGEGIENVTKLSDYDFVKAIFTRKDVKRYLFFTQTANGQEQAKAFLKRIKIRKVDRDKGFSWLAYRRQLRAINRWGRNSPADLSKVTIPVLIGNGEDDRMVPTQPNSYDLKERISNSQLVIYPDAGHAGVFQYGADFTKKVNQFLA